MRKIAIIAITGLFALACAGCTSEPTPAPSPAPAGSAAGSEATGSSTGMATPFQEVPTMYDAAQIVGFPLDVAEHLDTYSFSGALAYTDGSMIEAIFARPDNADQRINIRKAKGSQGDISGVYDEYPVEGTLSSGAKTRGTNDAIFVITWEKDGYTFSAYATEGVNEALADEIVATTF